MALLTLRILDGPERGTIFHQIATPVTIGREEGNAIQLNDERVSRYHLRITDDNGAVLLTDLESTNGTRVNGEAVHLWELRAGDLISMGRSQILVGSADEIARRLRKIRNGDAAASVPMGGDEFRFIENAFAATARPESTSSPFTSSPFEAEIFRELAGEDLSLLHHLPPPQILTDLSPRHSAKLAELLQYIHLRLRYLVTSVHMAESQTSASSPQASSKPVNEPEKITLSMSQWQNLIDLYGRIALYLHAITEP